jgi:predicted porin
MKKSLVALALMGAFSAAYAQSSVTIYGTIDAGVTKTSGGTTSVGKRDNNKLGFKGVEDLGSGLKALFQLEIRYEPDTGTIESVTRPLFQGESRVGLQGDFGTVRLGRGLTALQASNTAFEPWSGLPTPAGFQTDLQVAGYTSAYKSTHKPLPDTISGSDPLGPAGNSANRFSNALFYNTPVFAGFQLNVTVATKEGNGNTAPVAQYPIGSTASVNPYSVSGTYNNGPVAAMAAYERNAVETKLWSIAAAVTPVTGLKLMGSYQKQDQAHTQPINPDTKAWILGANYTMGAGKFLLGYGQKTPDGRDKTKQASAGYEYSLSARTYLYGELSNRKNSVMQGDSVNYYGLGMHHNF